jgi:hypothetical protein
MEGAASVPEANRPLIPEIVTPLALISPETVKSPPIVASPVTVISLKVLKPDTVRPPSMTTSPLKVGALISPEIGHDFT